SLQTLPLRARVRGGRVRRARPPARTASEGRAGRAGREAGRARRHEPAPPPRRGQATEALERSRGRARRRSRQLRPARRYLVEKAVEALGPLGRPRGQGAAAGARFAGESAARRFAAAARASRTLDRRNRVMIVYVVRHAVAYERDRM